MPKPQITEDLAPWVERIVDETVARHTLTCPVAPRVDRLEGRFYVLFGYMLGACVLGGAGSAIIIKLLG